MKKFMDEMMKGEANLDNPEMVFYQAFYIGPITFWLWICMGYVAIFGFQSHIFDPGMAWPFSFVAVMLSGLVIGVRIVVINKSKYLVKVLGQLWNLIKCSIPSLGWIMLAPCFLIMGKSKREY